MSRPAGWVILLLGAAVAGIGYLGFAGYPASLSTIPYLQKLLPFMVEGWGEQRDLYASIFESKLGVFVRGHPMEMMGGYGLIGLFPPPPPEPAKKTTRGRSAKQKARDDAQKKYEREIARIEKDKKLSAEAKEDLKKSAAKDLEEELQKIDKMP